MDHDIERRYHVERLLDFVRGLEEPVADLQRPEENRVLFRVAGRSFEALAWIDADFDLICVTTQTLELPPKPFEESVALLQNTLQVCWEHCVSVAPAEQRYDLSMAIFIGGFTFEAFEGCVYNLITCAEAIEESFVKDKKK